jgi:MarR family transcriptional regulator, organic hydroperoxide resistance regulator
MQLDLIGLFRDLVRLETDLWNRVDARLHREHGLPLAWLEVMQVVSTTPRCRVLDVAETLFITVGGASKVVDKIEVAGWCRRLPNPSDGRSNLIELTKKGEGLLEAPDAIFREAFADHLGAGAPASDLIQLSSTLSRLRRHLITSSQDQAERGN